LKKSLGDLGQKKQSSDAELHEKIKENLDLNKKIFEKVNNSNENPEDKD